MKRVAGCAKWIGVLSLVLLATGATPGIRMQTQGQPQRPTAVLAAMKFEVDSILERLTDKDSQTFLGIRFTTGRLEGRPVVVAVTGAGKVNAAVATTLLLDHFGPSEVIFTGIAAAVNPELHPGDVVVATKVAQHDMGAFGPKGFERSTVRNPANNKSNPVFIACDPNLIDVAHRVAGRRALLPVEGGYRPPKVTDGVIVSGDVFVASPEKRSSLHSGFEADAVEMEGAAVGQVCYQQQVPFLVIRGLSEDADGKTQDLKTAMRVAVQNSANLTMSLVGELNTAPAAAPAVSK